MRNEVGSFDQCCCTEIRWSNEKSKGVGMNRLLNAGCFPLCCEVFLPFLWSASLLRGQANAESYPKISAASRARDLNRSTASIPTAWRTANTTSHDGTILPRNANQAGSIFRKGQAAPSGAANERIFGMR